MTLKISTTCRKLKVTLVLDAAPFVALRVISDNAPSRTEVTVAVGGRNVTADIATKSVRKVVKLMSEHLAGDIVLIIQGVLTAKDRIDEAGLVAQVKTQAKLAASPETSSKDQTQPVGQ